MTTANSSEPPDFITLLSLYTGGEGFEVKPGIQFGGGCTQTIKRGEIGTASLVLQNALDVPVKAKVGVFLPRSRMFKKTNLSTITPIIVELGPEEVEQIWIPFRASLDTPEGDYEIEIRVEGTGGEGGKRIRGIRKELKDTHLAAGKSVAASIAVSAIGLFLTGRVIGGRTYVEHDRVTMHTKVQGQTDKPSIKPIEIRRRQYWTELHRRIDFQLGRYLKEMLSKYSSDRATFNYVADTFTDLYEKLFESVGHATTDEERLWLGRGTTYAVLVKGGFYRYDISLPLLDKVVGITQQNKGLERPLQEVLDFREDVLGFWLGRMKEKDRFKWLFAHLAANYTFPGMREKNPKTDPSALFSTLENFVIRSLTTSDDGRDAQREAHLLTAIDNHLMKGIGDAEKLFEGTEETLRHLESLKATLLKRSDQTHGLSRQQAMLQKIETKEVELRSSG